MNLHRARSVADAVMMEGYALYPYRASAPKNRYRWTFGTLAPRAWSEAGGCEPWWLEAQLLVAGTPTRIAGQLRFFQIERRDGAQGRWDEGIVRTVDFDVANACQSPFSIEASLVRDGTTARACAALSGRIATRKEWLVAARPLTRITIRVENTTAWTALDASRDEAVAGAFASTHLVLGVEGGELISAIDPPAWVLAATPPCTSTRTYPVLVGPDVMLCAPFILYDHPQLAPESAGETCDGTEIDELLVLRTRTLTDDEKRQARATDPRTAAIVDRAEGLPPAWLERLHGATRDLREGEMIPKQLAVGSKVRLRVPARRTDAQDLLYAGHVATVVTIEQDVDGTVFYAVTVDDDPAAALHDWYGRYRYYRTDEVEPL